MAAKNIKIFIASSNEVKAERVRAVLLMNELRKAHRHLDLEAIEWEYDIAPGSQPGNDTVQGAINPLLEESHLLVFIFFSRIGKYTKEEFELAIRLGKKFFVLFKNGYSPRNKAEIEAYAELIEFKESLSSTVLYQHYDDEDDLDKLLYRSLNLYLAQTRPAEQVPLPADVIKLIQLLNEKEEQIKELKGLLPATNENIEMQRLSAEIDTIKAELAQSEALRQQQAADKAALEQQLTSQKDNNKLKGQALDAVEAGDYDKAENLLKESAKDSIATTAATFYELAKLKKLQLQYRPAFEYYELAARLEQGNAGYLHEAGVMANQLGYFDKGIDYYGKSLPLAIAEYGVRHHNIAIRYNNLGEAYRNKGQYDKAMGHYNQALSIDKEFYGERHPKIAIRYNNLGVAYYSKGEYDKAIEYYEQALSIDKEFYGERHPKIAIRYNNLGAVYYSKGEYDKAIEYYEQALSMDKEFYGERHPDIATDYNNLGAAYYSKGEYDKAIEYYDQALDIDKGLYGERHPDIATDYNNLGVAYDSKGEYDKAVGYYDQAIAIIKDFVDDTHPSVQMFKRNLQSAITAKTERENSNK